MRFEEIWLIAVAPRSIYTAIIIIVCNNNNNNNISILPWVTTSEAMTYIHCVSEKREQQYFVHNFNKFKQCCNFWQATSQMYCNNNNYYYNYNIHISMLPLAVTSEVMTCIHVCWVLSVKLNVCTLLFRGHRHQVAAIPAQQNVASTSIAAYKDRMVRYVHVSSLYCLIIKFV